MESDKVCLTQHRNSLLRLNTQINLALAKLWVDLELILTHGSDYMIAAGDEYTLELIGLTPSELWVKFCVTGGCSKWDSDNCSWQFEKWKTPMTYEVRIDRITGKTTSTKL